MRLLRRLPPPPGPRPDDDDEGRASRSRSSTTRPSTSRSSSRSTRAATPQGALATAVKVAARRRRGIHVLVTIAVPASSPIDAEMPEQELAAQAIIEQARMQGGRRVTGHCEKVRAGPGRAADRRRGAGDARAGDRHAAARRATGGSLFGKTLETVLAERPCRVIIHSDAARQHGDARDPRAAGRRRGPDRRLACCADARPARAPPERRTRVLSVVMLVARRRDDRARARPPAAARSPSGSCSASCSSPRGSGGLSARARARPRAA